MTATDWRNLRRRMSRAVRLGDKLRQGRRVAELELRARLEGTPWQTAQIERWTRRLATTSARLERVERFASEAETALRMPPEASNG
jgi:hypothetical protein